VVGQQRAALLPTLRKHRSVRLSLAADLALQGLRKAIQRNERHDFPFESSAWERLHASYDTRRVNHSQEYATDDGTSVNQAESYFSRLRRAEIGQHHRISGRYLYQYANEMAWREDNRRLPNGMNWRLVTGAALRHAKSQTWAGYWQRAAA
jgi:hypothetical protein